MSDHFLVRIGIVAGHMKNTIRKAQDRAAGCIWLAVGWSGARGVVRGFSAEEPRPNAAVGSKNLMYKSSRPPMGTA
jgi:hypothetical protein